MNKEKCLILFCHEACEILMIDKAERKKLFSYFYVWNFKNYSEVIEEVDRIMTFVKATGLSFFPMNVINLYFEKEERVDLYKRLFDYLRLSRRYKNSVELLEKVESAISVDKAELDKIRFERITESYKENAGLEDYVQAIMASLWMAFENDHVFDGDEYKLIYPYAVEIKRKYPEFNLNSFDFRQSLKFTDVSMTEKESMKSILEEAIKADGKVDVDEIKIVKKILPNISIGESNKSKNTLIPFLSLMVLLSDGKLTDAEKSWFEDKFEVSSVISNFEESMWFLSILAENVNLLNENKKFFSKLWGRQKKFYDLSNILFLTYYKKIVKGSEHNFNLLSKFLSKDSSLKYKSSLKKLNAGEVIEEEILIILNFVFSENYDLAVINQRLTSDYLKDIFLSLKSSPSRLKHFAVADLALNDKVINNEEYELLWKSFASLSLDPKVLKEAFYDISLIKLIDYELGEYFTYLTEETV